MSEEVKAVETMVVEAGEVSADEVSADEDVRWVKLLLGDDLSAKTKIKPNNKFLTVQEVLEGIDENGPQWFWQQTGLYRSTVDESAVKELTKKRDEAIATGTSGLPESIASSLKTQIKKQFDKQIANLERGDNNAKLLGHYAKTGNIQGLSAAGNPGSFQGAEWFTPNEPWAMIYKSQDSAYLFTDTSWLIKGKCPDNTTFDAPADGKLSVAIFRIRGKVSKRRQEGDKFFVNVGKNAGFEFLATIEANPSPSGINKAVQTHVKQTTLSVNGWQSLAIPVFEGTRPGWLAEDTP